MSGNRNFEGRIHPDTRANYLASPPLVIAYAIAGRIDIDFETEPVRLFIHHTRIPPSYSRKFQFITYLLSIYHSLDTTQKTSLFSCVTFGRREMSCKQWRKSSSFQGFSKRSIQKSPPVMNAGTSLKCPLAKTTNGKKLPPTSSGRHFLKVRNPFLQRNVGNNVAHLMDYCNTPNPYLLVYSISGMTKDIPDSSSVSIQNATVLLNLGDSVTTDHISPAGSIARSSSAARYSFWSASSRLK